MAQQWVDAAVIRGARAAGVVAASLLTVLLLASVWAPEVVFWPPAHRADERLLFAVLLALPLALGLALRDPVRNAGVFATIGLVCGFLAAARIVNAATLGAPERWYVSTVLLLAVGAGLVLTYARLRRPHPIIVRVVVVATALMPVVLYVYDLLAGALRAP